MAIAIEIAAEVNVASELIGGLRPQVIKRGWSQRWDEIQKALTDIEGEYDPPPTTEAVRTANQRLFSFYVQAYHLKDVLIHEHASGLTKDDVEDAINATPALKLLADLANLDKHYKLNRPPRSGDVPVLVDMLGEFPGSGGPWRLRTDIKHLGVTRDGIAVAREAVEAWRQLLQGWGLN